MERRHVLCALDARQRRTSTTTVPGSNARTLGSDMHSLLFVITRALHGQWLKTALKSSSVIFYCSLLVVMDFYAVSFSIRPVRAPGL